MPASGQAVDPPEDYRETRPVESTLASLVRRIETVSGKSVCLNSPASEAEISGAEKIMGVVFPEDLRTLYGTANGQRNAVDCAPLLWNGGAFMSLEEVVRQWTVMHELWSVQDEFRTDYGARGAVRGVHWMPEWMPFGDFGTGDLHCIDFAPTDRGSVGQVIGFVHDDTDRALESTDVNSFLGSLDDALRRDVASYELGYGVRPKR